MMLTLEEVCNQQTDLTSLCADRPLKTCELFSGSAFYGSSAILKAYTGLPQDYPLKGVVPHGPFLIQDFIWQEELDAPLPVIFRLSPDEQTTYQQAVKTQGLDKVIAPLASPFLYLMELLKDMPKPDRRGTLFFPAHSTHHVTTQMDFEALADQLVNLEPEYQPVTICLYWKDFNLGHHIPFQNRELPLVSAGHMFDPWFQFRLYHLCSLHRYAASNELGSSVFYATKAGCSYFYLDQVKAVPIAKQAVLERDAPPVSSCYEVQLRSLFNQPQPQVTLAQQDLVDYWLGASHLKTPDQLRHELLAAEVLYDTQREKLLWHYANTLRDLQFEQAVTQAVQAINGRQDQVALAACDRALTLRPDLPGLHYGRAIVFARQGQLAQALVALKELLVNIPTHVKGNAWWAALQEKPILISELEGEVTIADLTDLFPTPLPLKKYTFLLFPDWSQPETVLEMELTEVLKAMVNHPHHSQITFLIDIADLNQQEVDLWLSGLMMNLWVADSLTDQVSIDDLAIALLPPLGKAQWQFLWPQVQARIILPHENQAATSMPPVLRLPSLALSDFSREVYE